ncbi:MAG TPA: DUF4249 domain-containing protein [Lacibacter sp.]|nr:DUF4249 domain-containing protein [Lacibacter sp.]HMO89826.1 DUF4249 domain-containing protein [Lacibacter sp.]HMP86518.1 DUF4249 domain-containing protein [Lacibacter sp.]
MRKFSTLVLLWLLFSGCEKVIDFELKEAAAVLSVDARIETDRDPVVVLTSSLNYFSTISAGEVASSIIRNAEVILEEGSRSHRLRRIDQTLPGGLAFSFYTTDDASPSTRIVGEEGKTYRLLIRWEGREYRAVTTIPLLTKTIDSLWWVRPPNDPDTSTRALLRGRVTDPPGFGNYIRYFTRVNSGPFLPGFNSVFDDQFVNNSTIVVDIDRGVDRNNPGSFEDYGFFRRGDTVTVQFSNIDKATFDFWRTVEFNYQSIGNPFSSPPKILGNISNGALGYFGGYANQFSTLVIRR